MSVNDVRNATGRPDASKTGALATWTSMTPVVFGLEAKLADHRRAGLDTAPEVRPERRRFVDPDQRQEPEADRVRAVPTQHRRAGQVDLQHHAARVERQVRHGREVVEIGVAAARLLERGVGLSQLAVLQLELDLVDFELVHEPIAVRVRLVLVEQRLELGDQLVSGQRVEIHR